MPATRGIAVLAAVAIVFVSAGWTVGKQVVEPEIEPIAADAVEEVPATTAPTTVAPSTTAVPHPSPQDPLRVVLAGDSVMAGLVPPIEAALEGGGATEVRFVLTPAILRDATVRFSWQKELEEFNPELIVMFVGFWELGQIQDQAGQSVGPTEEGWREAYEREVLDPWIDFITQADAQVIWIGTPAIDNPEQNESFVTLNDMWRSAADRWGPVTFVDAGERLGRPEDGFFAFVRNDQGRRVRVRQTDGLHLCAAGAEMLATDVLGAVNELWGVPVAPDWQSGAWVDDPAAYPADHCP